MPSGRWALWRLTVTYFWYLRPEFCCGWGSCCQLPLFGALSCFLLAEYRLVFFIAASVSAVLAALSYRFKMIRELLTPLMLAIRSVPVASFIILVLVWFSSRSLSVLISFLMVLPIIYSSVLTGISTCDKQLIEMAAVFKMPTARRIRYIYLPQVMPFFKSGCGSALGLCWKAGIAAEVIGMPTGSIGEKLQQAKVYLDTPDLFAWTLVIVLVSLLFERMFIALLNKAERILARV